MKHTYKKPYRRTRVIVSVSELDPNEVWDIPLDPIDHGLYKRQNVIMGGGLLIKNAIEPDVTCVRGDVFPPYSGYMTQGTLNLAAHGTGVVYTCLTPFQGDLIQREVTDLQPGESLEVAAGNYLAVIGDSFLIDGGDTTGSFTGVLETRGVVVTAVTATRVVRCWSVQSPQGFGL